MSLSLDPEVRIRDKEDRDGYASALTEVTVPKQIRALRERRGLTQNQLAEAAGMRQSRISVIETPGGNTPNLKTLLRIAAAMDVGLLVWFVPFSELIAWDRRFFPDEFDVPSYDEDTGIPAPASGDNASPQAMPARSRTAPPALPPSSELAAQSRAMAARGAMSSPSAPARANVELQTDAAGRLWGLQPGAGSASGAQSNAA